LCCCEFLTCTSHLGLPQPMWPGPHTGAARACCHCTYAIKRMCMALYPRHCKPWHGMACFLKAGLLHSPCWTLPQGSAIGKLPRLVPRQVASGLVLPLLGATLSSAGLHGCHSFSQWFKRRALSLLRGVESVSEALPRVRMLQCPWPCRLVTCRVCANSLGSLAPRGAQHPGQPFH